VVATGPLLTLETPDELLAIHRPIPKHTGIPMAPSVAPLSRRTQPDGRTRFQLSYRPPVFVIGMTALCSLACFIGLNVEDAIWTETINWLIPVVVLFSCAVSSYLSVTRNVTTIWSPVPLFLLASALYYGFGPLVYVFGNASSVYYCDIIYQVNSTSLMGTNLLNCVGILTVLFTFSVCLQLFGKVPVRVVRKPDPIQLQRLLYLFLAIGMTTKYLVVLPYMFGQSNYVMSGFVLSLTAFTTAATFLLVYLSALDRRYLAFTILYCGVELGVAFLTLQKLDVLFTALMIFLALHSAYQRARILVIGGISCMALYLVISPIVSEARLALGNREDKSLTSRYQMMESRFLLEDTLNSRDDETQYWWTRLNYANSQTYGMREFDAGRPGKSLENSVYAIIPRWLWPNKPIQTYGADLNEALLRSRSSNLGIGIFGEAYWNGGWIGLVLACAFVGLEFAVLTALGARYISARDFRWLPCAVIGFRMGLRPDDWFVTLYVGPAVIGLAFFVMTYWIIPPPQATAGRRPI
jgi:hypothetical protein